MKIAIIYRGNIRGFKYEECFRTHEILYNELLNNNIYFDTYLCTNNIEYDENSINKIKNLKGKYILNIDDVRNDSKYIQALSNITFTSPGWNNNYQNNIITYFYNNNYLYDKIIDKYDKYINYGYCTYYKNI